MKSILHQQPGKLGARSIASLQKSRFHGIEKKGLRVEEPGRLYQDPYQGNPVLPLLTKQQKQLLRISK